MLEYKLKRKIDEALEEFLVQPVGNGYIDCICPMGNAAKFIDRMTALGIQITGFSWWCHVTEGHLPCGMGGPANLYGNGRYSEIEMFKTYDFSSNQAMKEYLLFTWNKEKSYKPCYVPAFYLDVPDKWKNGIYVK